GKVFGQPRRRGAIRLLGARLILEDADRGRGVAALHEVVSLEPVDAPDDSPNVVLALGERVGQVSVASVGSDTRVHGHLLRSALPPVGRTLAYSSAEVTRPAGYYWVVLLLGPEHPHQLRGTGSRGACFRSQTDLVRPLVTLRLKRSHRSGGELELGRGLG